MMNNLLTPIINVLRVLEHGDAPFYATDLKLCGAEIAALAHYSKVIEPTGNEKEVVVENKTFRVKEWKLADFDKWDMSVQMLFPQYLNTIIEHYDSICKFAGKF